MFYYTFADGNLISYSIELSTVHCNVLLKDSQQRIWLGTTGQGLVCIMPNGIIKQNILPGHTIRSAIELSDGTLYVSTIKGSVDLSLLLKKFEKVAEVPEISSFTVYQLIPYEKDCLAGIGQKGWFIYNYKKKNTVFSLLPIHVILF